MDTKRKGGMTFRPLVAEYKVSNLLAESLENRIEFCVSHR